MSDESPAAGSRISRFRDWSWEDIESIPYKERGEDFRRVVRHVLASGGSLDFEARYFELEPGGFTSFERHRHEHVVMVLRGEGRVRLGEEETPLAFGDVVRIGPGRPHRFLNATDDEPFGFLCIVDRERDRPISLPPEAR